MSTLGFVDLLNETAVVYVPNLGARGWGDFDGIAGFEAYSPGGEIQAFATWREAHDWRIAEILAWGRK